MQGLIYWMVFQMLIGVWLAVSPLVMEFREMKDVSSNNILVGGVVFILGLGVALYKYYHEGENACGVDQMSGKSV
jgi:hypothetical protein